SSAQAMTKLRDLGIGLDATAGGQPTIDPGSAARWPASANFAAAQNNTDPRATDGSTFPKHGQPRRQRSSEPYALLDLRDRAYLFRFALDRPARRTFRLSRVEGAISRLGGREPGDYSIPEDFSPRLALQSSSEMAVVTEARLSIDAHRADPLRRR